MLPPDPQSLAGLRMDLAESRINLRNAEAELLTQRAKAEAHIVEMAGGDKALGANEEARKRAILIALDSDPSYQAYRQLQDEIAGGRDEIDRLQAALDGMEDTRRAYEWSIRARLCDALGGSPRDEFQDAADEATTRRVTRAVSARPEVRASDIWEDLPGASLSANPGGADDGDDLPF